MTKVVQVFALFVVFLVLWIQVLALDVEWLRNNPKEAFEVLQSAQFNYENQEGSSTLNIVNLDEVEGVVTTYCAVQKREREDAPFKSNIYNTFKTKNGVELTLLLDERLGEQPQFSATIERGFAVNNEFVVSKRSLLRRQNTAADTHSHLEHQHASETKTTKITRRFGGQKILWLRAIFNDTRPAVGWPTNPEVAWNSIRLMDRYFKQYSYNQSWVDIANCNVSRVYTYSFNKSQVNNAGMLSDAILRFSDADGYVRNNYDFIIAYCKCVCMGRACSTRWPIHMDKCLQH